MTRFNWDRATRESRGARNRPLEPWSSVVATLSSAGSRVFRRGDRRSAGVVDKHLRAARRAFESASTCTDAERVFYLRLANGEIDAASLHLAELELRTTARDRLQADIDALRVSLSRARDELIVSVSKPG